MVDVDKLDKEKGGSSGSKKSKKKGKSSSSGSSDSDSDVGAKEGAYKLDDDEMMDPSDMSVSQQSKDWADEHGELNYDRQGSESLQAYMSRQVEEVKELHQNMRKRARQNNENLEQFTLVMHTLLLNFANNRVGIAKTVENQYNKSTEESMRVANKVCQKAGEKDCMEKIVQDITANLLELE